MVIIDVNQGNIDKEHICCALSKKDIRSESKKEWMKEQFSEGLSFKKLDKRGKVFIEYMPLENAFAPVVGKDYMYINCLWISGQHKGEGYGNLLLDECIRDSKEKGKKGIVVLSAIKKKPFLSDGDYFKYRNFSVVDTMEPYYELLAMNFDGKDDDKPKFIRDNILEEGDVVVYYTNQCPHNALYIDLIENIAYENNIDLKFIKLSNKVEAKKSPNPFTTYSIYVKGQFITNEILSEKKFIKLMETYKLM